MSHFTVLVPAQNEDELFDKLQPYQENNMGDCPKEYLEFVRVDKEDEEDYDYYENDADYHQIFWTWIESLPGDTRLYLIDCHI